MIKVNSKLLWKKNIFDFRYKKNWVYIGRELLIWCRILGRWCLLEGVCIIIRFKKFGKVILFFVLWCKIFGILFFVDFFIYLIGVFNFEIRKFLYSCKISCFRLIYVCFLI